MKRLALMSFCLLAAMLMGSNLNKTNAQEKNNPKFKVIAFYTPSLGDKAHVSFSRECNRWFPKMAEKHGFQYDSTANWGNVNADFLSQYQVVLFLDNYPSAGQRAAFEQYMRSGGSWMGFHVCAFNQNPSSWDWYFNQFLGMGSYRNNTWAPTSAILDVETHDHPATANLPDKFTASVNEWYGWMVDLRTKKNIKVLCSVNEESYPLGDGTGSGGASEIWTSGYHPVVWTNTDYNMIYLNMGHNKVNYGTPLIDYSNTFGNEVQDKLVLDALFWLAEKNMPDPRRTIIDIKSPKIGEKYVAPANIKFEVMASDSDGIASVDFYNGSKLLSSDKEEPYAFSWENVSIGNYNITIKASDKLGNTTSTSITVKVDGKGAYNGNIPQIPGKIEMENFDYGGEGIGYHDADSENQGTAYRPNDGVDIETCSDNGGGYNVGYTEAKEWIKYTVNITKSQEYTVEARVATNTNTNKKFHIELDGEDVTGPIILPKTGGWQNWQTVSAVTTKLPAGEKEMKIVFDTDGFNINHINFSEKVNSAKTLETGDNIVFPNPSSGKVTIRFKKPLQSNDSLSIFNNNGQLIKRIDTAQFIGQTEYYFDFTEYGQGLYLLQYNHFETKVQIL